MREQISLIAGAIMGAVAYFVGGFDPLITVFATILVLDTLTGMLKAWNSGQYESQKFRKGIIHKFSYIIGIILAVQFDLLMGGSGVLRDAVVSFFVANEAMSILENLGDMGVRFPAVFENAIKSLREKNPTTEEQEKE